MKFLKGFSWAKAGAVLSFLPLVIVSVDDYSKPLQIFGFGQKEIGGVGFSPFQQGKAVPEPARIYRASRPGLRTQVRFRDSFAINQKRARSLCRVEALRAGIAVLIRAIPSRSGAS